MAEIKTGYASLENKAGIEYNFEVDFYLDSDGEIDSIYLDKEFHESVKEPLNDDWFLNNGFLNKTQKKNIYVLIYEKLFNEAKEWYEAVQQDLRENLNY